MSIGGEHGNVSGGQVGGQVPVSGPSTDPNSPSFSNPVLEATLLNQLVNITQPASDMPSTTIPEGSVQEDSNSQSDPLAPIGEKQEQSQGKGSSGGQEKGDGERSNDQNAGYNSSVLAQSTAGDSALVMAYELKQAFTESDYAQVVASSSIANAQVSSSGALAEASDAASETRQSSIDQANAQITQAAGSIGGSAVSMGAIGMGSMSEDNITASKTLDSYSATNKAFTAYKETPPPGPRGDLSTTNAGVAKQNGVVTNTNDNAYNPQNEKSLPLSSREIDIDPQTNGNKVTYTASDRIAYEKWNATTISKRVSNPPVVDERSSTGLSAQQKINSIQKDITNGTNDGQRPDGWYTANDRAQVAQGKPLSPQDDPTGDKTRAILQDLKLGGFDTPENYQNTAIPDPKHASASLNYNENGIATTADNPGANLAQGQTKLSRFNEFSSNEIGANPDGTLKQNGGPVYTAQDREQYLAAQKSKKPDGIQDDDVNGISASAKRRAIEEDLNANPENTNHMFLKGTYTTQDRQEFYATGKLSNDPDGSKRTAILKDLHASGSSDAIQHIKEISETGFQNAFKNKLDIQQRYSIYAQAFSGAITGFTGIGAAELNIQAASAKQTADLDQATAQQLSSVQSMNSGQGMAIAGAAIQAAANATGAISQALQINVQLR